MTRWNIFIARVAWTFMYLFQSRTFYKTGRDLMILGIETTKAVHEASASGAVLLEYGDDGVMTMTIYVPDGLDSETETAGD